MVLKSLIIIIFSVSITLSELNITDEAINSLSKQNEELKSVKDEVTKEYLKILHKGAEAIKNSFSKSTQNETKAADEASSHLFPLGDLKLGLPDTVEKINDYCDKREKYREVIKNWIHNRFPLSLIVKLTFRLYFKSIIRKNDIYCANETTKENYVKNAIEINKHKENLNVFRGQYIDNLIDVRKPTFALRKLGQICCAYWSYRRNAISAIVDYEPKLFLTDMLDGYNTDPLKYICFYHSENSKYCKSFEDVPPQKQQYNSFIIDTFEALSLLTSVTALM